MMKITTEHYAEMRATILKLKDKVPALRHAIIKEGRSKDVEKRLRWDLLYLAQLSPWICSEIYVYADDEHIDTALRSIMKEMGE